MNRVFIDSGAFIAELDRSDALHEDVHALFAGPTPRWSTSILVVSETYGWLLHRMGEQAARVFRTYLTELRGLDLLPADAKHHMSVAGKLERLRGTKLTYVDASSLVWLKAKGIRTVWGTDHHLGLEGATVVPGSRSV
ncbi:MAG: type II toxin-antitoxin system VapC family toxin [Planctomycetota bacterium]